MGDLIFKMRPGGALAAVQSTTYGSEAALQQLLADNPEVMVVGGHRWLLVRREVPVAVDQVGSGVWALDHLFIDEEAVPTLIETKLASNPQARREVVGQMLDYAANGSTYWPIERIKQWFSDTASAMGANPDAVLEDFIDESIQPHEFWDRVRVNLEAGRLRLLFIADQIPVELQRIVEFLNEQMSNTEVLALEIRKYVDDGTGEATLIPRLFGLTARAQTARPEGRRWNESSLLEALRTRVSDAEVKTAQAFVAWGRRNQDKEWWGEGSRAGSYYPGFVANGMDYWPVTLWSYGAIAINFHTIARRQPFSDEALRREFRDRLVQIPGVPIPDEALARAPSVPLKALAAAQHLEAFLSVLDWAVARIRPSSPDVQNRPTPQELA